MLDTTRDTDTLRVLPWLIPTLLTLLRTGEPVFRKDVPEYQFRKVLLEILIRIPVGEPARTQSASIVECILHLLRNDNEDNVILACKIYVDLVRNYRCLTEENLTSFTTIFQESQHRMQALVQKYLAEDSEVVDSNEVFSGMDSPKVVAEMSLDMALFSQFSRNMIVPAIKATIQSSFSLLDLESPAQKKAREDSDAMGSVWTGMSTTIKNPTIYHDLISAQIKVCCDSLIAEALTNHSYRCFHTLPSLCGIPHPSKVTTTGIDSYYTPFDYNKIVQPMECHCERYDYFLSITAIYSIFCRSLSSFFVI